MKTRSDMVEWVRTKLADVAESAWTDSEILREMEEAWETVLAELAESESGRRTLMLYAPAESLVADLEIYSLPSDCLLMYSVQWRSDSTRDWIAVPYAKPPEGGHTHVGTLAVLGLSQPGALMSGLGWYDDVDPGNVRIWPGRATVDGEQYRLRYAKRLPFPSANGATLRDPEDTGSDGYVLPDRIDTALCALTAAGLAMEELEDGRPIGAFGDLYGSFMRGIMRSSRVLRPPSRHIGGA